jgi:putative endonuclease
MNDENHPASARIHDAADTENPWMVYILECQDGSFYTGVTNDIERRQLQHNEGTASRYTRSRRPVVLRYKEACGSRSDALIRECALRLLSRKEKEALVAQNK